MNWNEFRNAMDALERQIQHVNCQAAPTVKQNLAKYREKLLEEQTNYALGSAAYLKRLDELFGNLHRQGCLIPKGSEGEAITYFDELVKHAMIAGTYDVLDKWGVRPFLRAGVKAGLGHPKNIFIRVFQYKAKSGDVPASAHYYEYLAKEFTQKLSD
ncbi:MAG: hypothetical protein KME20_12215 [Kaiparowitsia implicata GSE-PSE-MK54-09C]|jgi:hypothetical protein|nr:hypothetical protein [Kaiparowitsia implicata GSE-PSE-MK54-09C]